MLELSNLTKVYKMKSENVVALNKVNLYFGETGMVFVIGKSGSGKTTLLNVVGGLDSFDEGDLIVKGKSFANFKQQDFDDYRNTFIGFVFQEYNLLDEMTVEKNISLAMELQGSKKGNLDKINDILKRVDLEGLNNRHPSELSGGQKQRVAIARALVKEPKIILTDEPTGALDTNSGIQVMNLLKELSRDRLVLIVSHNMDLARAYADRIIEMKDGCVEKDYTLKRDSNNKELRLKEVRNKVVVRRGVKLTDKDLKLLQAAVEQCKDVEIVDDDHFYEEIETEKGEPKHYEPSDAQFIKGKLGFGNTLKMGLSNLKIKPLRLVVTILLCAIAFSVFGLFDAMTIYDESRLTANTLKNSNVPSVVLNSSIREQNGDEYKINVDQSLIDNLRGTTGMYFKGVYAISPLKPDETKSIANISKYYATTKMTGVIEVTDEEELSQMGLKLDAGRLPQAFDEIAITSYYAMCLINYGYNYGDVVINATNCRDYEPTDLLREDDPLVLTLNKNSYKIVGIIDAGKVSSKYDVILDNYANAVGTLKVDFENYINNSFYLYGFVKDRFVEQKYIADQTLTQYKNSSYNYKFNKEVKDVNGNKTYASIDNAQFFFNYDELVKTGKGVKFLEEGKTSLAENEILVSIQQFENIYAKIIAECQAIANSDEYKYNTSYQQDMLDLDGYLDTIKTHNETVENRFAAMKSAVALMCKSRYNHSISDFILNTKVDKRDTTRYENGSSGELAKVELSNDEYKIVGFYAGMAPSVSSGALVLTKGGMGNLGINVQQGAYSSMIAPSTKHTSQIDTIVSLVKRSDGLKFSCLNNVISIITLNHDTLQQVSWLFLGASAVFAIFAIAMLANYISTSINNRHTQIGILRALGTTGKGILLMFFAESLIIALINIVLSNVITAVCCTFLNIFFTYVINISIPLASYTFRQFAVIFALSLAVAFVASLAPIVKLSRKKPIETIRQM